MSRPICVPATWFAGIPSVSPSNAIGSRRHPNRMGSGKVRVSFWQVIQALPSTGSIALARRIGDHQSLGGGPDRLNACELGHETGPEVVGGHPELSQGRQRIARIDARPPECVRCLAEIDRIQAPRTAPNGIPALESVRLDTINISRWIWQLRMALKLPDFLRRSVLGSVPSGTTEGYHLGRLLAVPA